MSTTSPRPQRLNGRQLDLRRPRWVLLADVEFFPKCGFRILATSEYVRSSSPQCLCFFTQGFFRCFLASVHCVATLNFYGVLIVYCCGTGMCDSGVIEGTAARASEGRIHVLLIQVKKYHVEWDGRPPVHLIVRVPSSLWVQGSVSPDFTDILAYKPQEPFCRDSFHISHSNESFRSHPFKVK